MVKKICLLLCLFSIIYFSADAQTENKIIRKPIVNGLATYLPKPDYPQEARDFCASGTVSVEVEIDENGNVASANAIAGDELLREVSVEASRKAKFRVTNYGGKPIKVKGIVVYNFPRERMCIEKGIVNDKVLVIPTPILNVSPPKNKQTITVRIVIDENGNVIRAKSESGHPLIRVAFENAARQAKFLPTFVNPGPIRVKALLVYQFNPDGTIETNINGSGKSQKSVKNIIISCGVCVQKAVFLPKPEYPQTAKAVNASGTVNIKITIDEKGNVIEAEPSSGHPFLQSSAIKAALKARFMPTLISGKPVKVRTVIVYNFVSQ
jgi:TonB family protein